MAENKVLVTQKGYDELVEKLDYLISVKRREVAERLKTARELGDLSENSEYDDAKNEQAFVEGEIREIEAKIKLAEIIQADGANDVVRLGSKVVIKDVEFDEVETYEIVGTTEADPLANKISNESPVGKAILGQAVGTVVDVVVHPNKPALQYEIVEIKE